MLVVEDEPHLRALTCRVLDVAGGTADLSLAFARKVGKTGQVWLTDINNAMLTNGRDRLCNKGFLIPAIQCDGEKLPFPGGFDKDGNGCLSRDEIEAGRAGLAQGGQ